MTTQIFSAPEVRDILGAMNVARQGKHPND